MVKFNAVTIKSTTETTRRQDMNNKSFWITLTLANLCIVAFLGFTLRSKILFPLQFINYRHLISAHSHFAFGGWVTLSFLTLFTYTILPEAGHRLKAYQYLLWGFELTSFGMLFSFPFEGYGVAAIIFSTLFIFFTYGYSFYFIRHILLEQIRQPVTALSISALACLILSSAGPFTLAWLLASGSTNSLLYRDVIYYYLHFQYNGFFTLSVFTLLFNTAYAKNGPIPIPTPIKWFAWTLCLSVIPSYFLTLRWHNNSQFFKLLAFIGVFAIISYLIFLFKGLLALRLHLKDQPWLTRVLLSLALISFVIKSLLQIGTIFPDLGNAVFGLRPVIIGFLHLVFLGLVTFYILSTYVEAGVFDLQNVFTRAAFFIFIAAVIVQETILLIQGTGMLMGLANPIYNWLLWYISIFLFSGALMIFWARFKG